MGNKQSYTLNDGNAVSQAGNAEIAYTYDTAEGINMKKSSENPQSSENSLVCFSNLILKFNLNNFRSH